MAASGSSIVHSLEFEPKLTSERVFSTRAHIVLGLFTGELEEHWQAEIITVQALKEAEAKKEEAKWIVADTGKNLPNGASRKIPVQRRSLSRDLRWLGVCRGRSSVVYHLLPLTAYVVRFRAEDSEHKTVSSKEFGFTTLGVVEPEIVPPEFFEPLPGQNLVGGATSPKTAMFHAGVETNGAATQYEFSYAPEEAATLRRKTARRGNRSAPGATGAVTVAEDFAVTPEATITKVSSPEATYFARSVQARKYAWVSSRRSSYASRRRRRGRSWVSGKFLMLLLVLRTLKGTLHRMTRKPVGVSKSRLHPKIQNVLGAGAGRGRCRHQGTG